MSSENNDVEKKLRKLGERLRLGLEYEYKGTGKSAMQILNATSSETNLTDSRRTGSRKAPETGVPPSRIKRGTAKPLDTKPGKQSKAQD